MLGLGNNLKKSGLITPGIITDSLVLKHKYDASSVVPVSDGAAYFNGDADYIELGSQSGDLRLSGSNGSISCWIKPNIVGDDHQRLIDKSDGGNAANGYALMLHDDGTLQGDINSSSIIAPTRVLEAQKWYYVTWTWDGTTHKIYIDGVLDTSATNSAQPPSDTTNIRIGTWNHSTAREYKGYICNVGIWNEALTQAQVKSIMWKNYAGLTDSEKTNLVSWWNLSANANDSHGSNNGTLS